MADVVLSARGVSKRYPGTLALDAVDFLVHRASVNVLVGENGAGKSTLMRILAGVEQPTSGSLELEGRAVSLASTRDAAALGIAMIHQELNLLPNLSVAENIFMGREIARFGVIDRRAQQRQARELMARLEQPIDPRAMVGSLPLGQRQIVEIAKAIAGDVRVLIMDEPTSALSAAEIAVLFRLIGELKSRGVSIVYISHRLEELLTIGDSVTVLRDGRVVASEPAASATVGWMVEKMTGGAASALHRSEAPAASRPVLSVEGLSAAGCLRDISFTAAKGEIVGFYGLMGSSRTELFETLMGLRLPGRGSVALDGRRLDRLDAPARLRAGIALVPEERQAAGIFPALSVLQNITLASLDAVTSGFWLSPGRERRVAARAVGELSIRTAGLERPITSLSGGNQQKAMLARFLLTAPKALLLDEPTRGVDVGARSEIYAIVRRLAKRGMCVLFASSELQEVLALATRIAVMSQGRITAIFDAADASEQGLVAASTPRGGDSAYR
jgi:erythritol transport system ATP-binding protein